MEERSVRNDIVAIGLLAGIVFLVAALATYDPADPVTNVIPGLEQVYTPEQLVFPQNESVQNACGPIGAWTADFLFHVLGLGSYLLLIGLVALEIALFQKQSVAAPWMRTGGWALSLIGLTALATFLLPNTIRPDHWRWRLPGRANGRPASHQRRLYRWHHLRNVGGCRRHDDVD